MNGANNNNLAALYRKFVAKMCTVVRKYAMQCVPIILAVLLVAVWCGVLYKRSAPKAASVAARVTKGEMIALIRSSAAESLSSIDLSGASRISRTSDGTVAAVALDTAALNLAAKEVLEAAKGALDDVDHFYVNIPIGTLIGSDYLSGRGFKLRFRSEPYFTLSTDIESELCDAGVDQIMHKVTLKVSADVTLVCMGNCEQFELCVDLPVCEEVIVGHLSAGVVVK